MSVSNWSPVAANNNAPPPNGAPEGMPASTINDTMREQMASVRQLAEQGGWFDWGHSATYVSGTMFQVSGDQSAVYTEGRRVRATQTATITGTIQGTAVSANTDVTVSWDSGALANEALAVAVGPEPTSVSAGAGAIGDAKAIIHASIPSGWLEASGQALAKATYPELDALLSAEGYPFGSDASNFNLPNLNGRAPIGRGQGNTAEGGGAGSTYALGDAAGAETHTLVNAELPDPIGDANAGVVDSGVAINAISSGTGGSGVRNTGGGQAHENRGPVLALTWIVRVQ